jgi:hypothetical protein
MLILRVPKTDVFGTGLSKHTHLGSTVNLRLKRVDYLTGIKDFLKQSI